MCWSPLYYIALLHIVFRGTDRSDKKTKGGNGSSTEQQSNDVQFPCLQYVVLLCTTFHYCILLHFEELKNKATQNWTEIEHYAINWIALCCTTLYVLNCTIAHCISRNWSYKKAKGAQLNRNQTLCNLLDLILLCCLYLHSNDFIVLLCTTGLSQECTVITYKRAKHWIRLKCNTSLRFLCEI